VLAEVEVLFLGRKWLIPRDSTLPLNEIEAVVMAKPWRRFSTLALAQWRGSLFSRCRAKLQRRGSNQGVFPAEILCGCYPNLQLSVGTNLARDPRDVDSLSKAGDLQVSALYNFNIQPAMARPISFFESSWR
jgi:hypothetical protein